MSTELAPIVIFAYNRVDHLKQCIDSLKTNAEAIDSIVFIFSDGPKSEVDIRRVQDVRDFANSITGFKEIQVIEIITNLGLACSVISGVGKICDEYGRVIVLEDDLIVSPFFLRFMNEALVKYKDNEDIISIHGYVYPLKSKLDSPFFLKGADCWGWGTWSRGWKIFNPDGRSLMNQLKTRGLIYKFNFNNSFPYFDMLRNCVLGKNSSWAIRWYASAFLEGKLTLYPNVSLVRNIGLDKSGTHCLNESNLYESSLSKEPLSLLGVNPIHSNYAEMLFTDYFNSIRPKTSMGKKIIRLLKSLVR